MLVNLFFYVVSLLSSISSRLTSIPISMRGPFQGHRLPFILRWFSGADSVQAAPCLSCAVESRYLKWMQMALWLKSVGREGQCFWDLFSSAALVSRYHSARLLPVMSAGGFPTRWLHHPQISSSVSLGKGRPYQRLRRPSISMFTLVRARQISGRFKIINSGPPPGPIIL